MRKFNTTLIGYDKYEVNKFVHEVTKEYENLLNLVKEKDKQIADLKKELEICKNLENTLKNTISVLNENNNTLESQKIVEKAKSNASRIVNDALLKAQKEEQKLVELSKKLATFKSRIKDALNEQEEFLEELDEIEY